MLFGSRARGDARGDSDRDGAVLLMSMSERRDGMGRLAGLRTDSIDETGFFFDLLPFPAGGSEARTPPIWDIRRHGRTR